MASLDDEDDVPRQDLLGAEGQPNLGPGAQALQVGLGAFEFVNDL